MGPLLFVFANVPDSITPASSAVARFNLAKRATCIAAHPTELLIASGDIEGAITLWFLDANLQLQGKTQMHWHAHGVSSLTFTNEGGYLLSGGEEAVLVVWQHSTGTKRFLPRQGAPLAGVIVDRRDLVFGVVCQDNSVRVIDVPSYDTLRVIQGLKLGPDGAAINARAGMCIDPMSGLVSEIWRGKGAKLILLLLLLRNVPMSGISFPFIYLLDGRQVQSLPL